MHYRTHERNDAVRQQAWWEPPREAPVPEKGPTRDTVACLSKGGVISGVRSRSAKRSWAYVIIVFGGREYSMCIEPGPTRTGLVRMALAFARRVVAEVEETTP